MTTSVRSRLAEVRERIEDASKRAGRPSGSVRLLAVSKGQPAAAIREAFEAGQRDFGENYVQELVEKARELSDLEGLWFHAIGSLQRNKVKDVVRVARTIHTVDRAELAVEIDKRATSPVDVLIEVNLGGEAQKAGVPVASAPALAESISRLSNLRLVGFMAIPPPTDDPEDARPFFRELRALRDRLSSKFRGATELSMGMSHDFEAAIAEGATMVRVGTRIFGARPART